MEQPHSKLKALKKFSLKVLFFNLFYLVKNGVFG